MLNVLSLLGPSRSGKSAIIPIITAIDNYELPFNTPDLDWYVDAYRCGDISANVLSKMAVNYMLCYSWYGHLGRHINLRHTDYYSLQNMMPSINLEEKHQREDKDHEFKNFMERNQDSATWSIFLWELPSEVYEIIENKYPVRTNPLYCYRSPYYLFTSWISSNRVARSNNLSRMFKYPAISNLNRDTLESQFYETRNHKEFTWTGEKYKYYKFNFDDVELTQAEESVLYNLVRENKADAKYWSERGMAYRYEHIVTAPEEFVRYLETRLGVQFDEELLKKGTQMMDKRTMPEVIELDIQKVDKTLSGLRCTEKTKKFIINEHSEYVDSL